MTLSKELTNQVNTHLNEVRKYLGNLPADERKEILQSIESHIYDAVESRGDGKPTPELVEAVIAEMDPPDSYGELPVVPKNRNRKLWGIASALILILLALLWVKLHPATRPNVIGQWETVDFVSDIKQFNPKIKNRTDDFYLKELTFLPDGKTDRPYWTWEDGILHHSGNNTDAKLSIKKISGDDYLFLEWMSGDVTLRGEQPKYYVLKRANSGNVQTAQPENVRAWEQIDSYTAPNFYRFFPDDPEGGKKLDTLWNAEDKDSRPNEEILKTVKNGLRCTKEYKTSILRWIGNKYIWNKSPQNPDAIEIMYHAADFSGENSDPQGTRHYAVYFGLSVVNPKSPAILRTLVDLCMKVDDPNDLSRVAWGAASQRQELLNYLTPYVQSKDKRTRNKAAVLEQIFTGKLKAFEWAKNNANGDRN